MPSCRPCASCVAAQYCRRFGNIAGVSANEKITRAGLREHRRLYAGIGTGYKQSFRGLPQAETFEQFFLLRKNVVLEPNNTFGEPWH